MFILATRIFLFLLVIMSLSVVSINCNGLRNKQKIQNIFSYMGSKKFDIICLQETFWNENLINSFVKFNWDGDIFYSNFEGDNFCKGVAILFRHEFDCNIISVKEIEKGRILEAKIECDDKMFYIYNVYAPNVVKDRVNFFVDFNSYLHEHIVGNDYFIVGDFNCVNDAKDKSNKRYPDTSVRFYNDLLSNNSLNDIWRALHPHNREYTWRRTILGHLIQSRIDKVLAPDHSVHFISSCSIVPFVWSDHDLLHTRIDLNQVARGNGTWIFNKSLLNDNLFVDDINSCIDVWKNNSLHDENIIQWYEELKVEFKCIAICHSKRLARAKISAKKRLQKQIKYEYSKAAKYDMYDLSLCKQLEDELKIFEEEECQGAIIRAKVKDIELGEKSNKYFFNLEKSRQKKCIIKSLQCSNGNFVNTSDEIVKEGFNFYSNLFIADSCDENVQNDFVDNISTSLSNDDVSLCKSLLTLDDLQTALSKMENNKSPGSDGLTSEFYKFFFDSLGPELLRIANAIYNVELLPPSMAHGLITLVPKSGDKSLLKNWRPITLLNIDYKIIAKALATKLTKVIENIISTDQTCCIPGRDIADNVMAMRDLIDYISDNNLYGFLVKVDQQKAFDRVSHTYLFKVLEKFGFPDYFINWIRIFYSNATSCVKINGFLS